MNQSQPTRAVDQRTLTLFSGALVRGAQGFTAESETGFVLWLEETGKYVTLRGRKRATLVFVNGVPFIDFHALGTRDEVCVHEMRIPCVDIIGMAEIGEETEQRRDELAQERQSRTLH